LTAKHKLNSGFVQGAFVVAGLLGLMTQSFWVFLVAVIVLVGLSFHDGSIRL